MRTFTKSLLLGIIFVFAACETNFRPNDFAFSETHEIEGVMVEAPDKAFRGKVVMPGLSPALQTAGDTVYFIYQHFDEDYPCIIGGETISHLDSVRVLARTAEAKDYNKSTYYCAEIIKILEVKSQTNNNPNGPDNRTPIDSSECYMLQEWNELGEPVKSYGCMRFDRNAGYTFADAYASIKTEIDSLVSKDIIEEKKSGNSYADKWELRQIIRDVTNSPNEKLVYKSLELYMYSNIWCAYVIVSQYCIIDSEGNIYYFITPTD